jgi:hypothetical protein
MVSQRVFRIPWHLVLPQQHGAWVMWGGPLLAGLGIARAVTPATGWLALASLGAFLALQPLTVLVKVQAGRRDRHDRRPAAVALAVTLGLMAVGGLGLWLSGAVWIGVLPLLALPVLVWQMALVARREERGQMGVELVGAGVLALNALAGYGLASGQGPTWTGVWLWLLCWLQAAVGIVHVFALLVLRRMKAAPPLAERLRIGARTWGYHAGTLLLVTALAAVGEVSWAVLPAFGLQVVDSLWAILWRPPIGVRPARIGLRQTLVTVLFFVVLIWGW